MKIGVKNVVKNIIDGLFPPRCRGCGASGAYLCDCCKKYISENMCVREVEAAGVFDWAVYLGYRDEILGELIEEAKYESVRGMLDEIAEVVWRGYFAKTEGEVMLVPMPTSRKHVRERAMDHMDRICREVERLSDGKAQRVRLLVRQKDTVQVGASSEVRRKQAKEAVRVSAKFVGEDGKVWPEYRKAKVILMDDVWTTGASMVEAGKLLKKAGVEDLTAVAITKSRTHRSPAIRHGEIV